MNWRSLQRSALAQIVLWPLSLLYSAVVRARANAYAKRRRKQKRLRGAVVSVGNLTVGGAGKTPMVLWLAEKFVAQGQRVAILSRGYRGKEGTSDEVALLRRHLHAHLGERATVAIGADRFAIGAALEAVQPVDIFILDDGFQHLQLARDVDILLLDASHPLAGEAVLPAGLLREPLSAMARADVLVFTRAETQPGMSNVVSSLQAYPVFAATTKLLGFRRLGRDDDELLTGEQIGGGPFLAFCGLGNPQQFFRDLAAWNIPVSGQRIFPDHHRYTVGDAATLGRAAKEANAPGMITTEKDANNLTGVSLQGFPVFVAMIAIEVSQEADFLSLIQGKIAQRAGAAS
jgi:tetraacyldisaccharide 4'-kinase